MLLRVASLNTCPERYTAANPSQKHGRLVPIVTATSTSSYSILPRSRKKGSDASTPPRTCALASARARLMSLRRASLRTATAGATVVNSEADAALIAAAERLISLRPSLRHQAENSAKSTSPLPSLRAIHEIYVRKCDVFVRLDGGAWNEK